MPLIQTISLKILMCLTLILALLVLSGCAPELPNAAGITPVTAIPTPSDTTLCSIGQDETQSWDMRLNALHTLDNRGRDCELAIDTLLYITYMEYGLSLDTEDESDAAIRAFETALTYYPDGTQAQNNIDRLQNNDIPDELLQCSLDAETTLSNYQPTDLPFVTVGESSLTLDGGYYPVYGVTYYPSKTPFDLFLTESALEDIETELALIAGAGINTLRIFLRHDDLFACDAPVPNTENFERLDAIIQIAAQNNLRVIAVLTKDIDVRVVYFEDYVVQQIQFIVERYRDEGAILGWDVRDAGDRDYLEGFIRRDIAMRWFADMIILIRTLDTNHPITLGFEADALATAPVVDIVSFQFYGDYQDLRQEIANLRATANRPILLAGTGYSTYTVSDITQRNLLFQTFEEVENNGLLGWVVNHAFDYPRTVTCTPPDCPGQGGEINQYGLWNTGYFPKLAVEAVRITTGHVEE